MPGTVTGPSAAAVQKVSKDDSRVPKVSGEGASLERGEVQRMGFVCLASNKSVPRERARRWPDGEAEAPTCLTMARSPRAGASFDLHPGPLMPTSGALPKSGHPAAAPLMGLPKAMSHCPAPQPLPPWSIAGTNWPWDAFCLAPTPWWETAWLPGGGCGSQLPAPRSGLDIGLQQ